MSRATTRRHLVMGALVSALTTLLVFGALWGTEKLLWATRTDRCERAVSQHTMIVRRNEACVKTSWHLGFDGAWRELSAADPFLSSSPTTRFRRAKTAGVTRVAVIGESSAAHLGDALTRIADAAPCGVHLEVLNCGDPSGSLEDVERRWREVREYDPDVTVLVFGHNLRFEWPEDGWRTNVETKLAKSCLATDVLGLRPRGFTYGTTENRLPRFRQFLEQLTTEIHARGRRLIVTEMAPNYWMPPTVEDPSDFMTTRYFLTKSTAGEPFDPTQFRHEIKAPDEFLIGVQLARQHHDDEARAHLRRALELDVAAGRVANDTNVFIHEFARSHPGVAVHELGQSDANGSRLGHPGWLMLIDACHLSPPEFMSHAAGVTAMVTTAPAEQRERCHDFRVSREADASLPQSPLWRTLSGAISLCASRPMYSSWCQAIPLALEEHLRANPDQTAAIMTSLLQSNVWTGLPLEQRGEVTAFLAQGYLRTGQVDRAKTMLVEAVRDGGPAAWTEAGFLELESGTTDRAEALFARALAKRPDDRGLQRVLELIRGGQQASKPN